MRTVIFTMDYQDQWATKGACCEILETMLDIILNLPSLSEKVIVRFQKPEGIIFGAKTIIYAGREQKVRQVNRFDIPRGLSHQQWVELIAFDLRMHLRIAGLRCNHEVIASDTPGDWDLIFTPR